ncbi:hypothetical protein J2S89_002651 [Arthrobacter bambusae]|nr:hypothetical protein [Arthrobacter bambusae]MDQ0099177.1 hypothetical protein [Arthrobacter bambusae]
MNFGGMRLTQLGRNHAGIANNTETGHRDLQPELRRGPAPLFRIGGFMFLGQFLACNVLLSLAELQASCQDHPHHEALVRTVRTAKSAIQTAAVMLLTELRLGGNHYRTAWL